MTDPTTAHNPITVAIGRNPLINNVTVVGRAAYVTPVRVDGHTIVEVAPTYPAGVPLPTHKTTSIRVSDAHLPALKAVEDQRLVFQGHVGVGGFIYADQPAHACGAEHAVNEVLLTGVVDRHRRSEDSMLRLTVMAGGRRVWTLIDPGANDLVERLADGDVVRVRAYLEGGPHPICLPDGVELLQGRPGRLNRHRLVTIDGVTLPNRAIVVGTVANITHYEQQGCLEVSVMPRTEHPQDAVRVIADAAHLDAIRAFGEAPMAFEGHSVARPVEADGPPRPPRDDREVSQQCIAGFVSDRDGAPYKLPADSLLILVMFDSQWTYIHVRCSDSRILQQTQPGQLVRMTSHWDGRDWVCGAGGCEVIPGWELRRPPADSSIKTPEIVRTTATA